MYYYMLIFLPTKMWKFVLFPDIKYLLGPKYYLKYYHLARLHVEYCPCFGVRGLFILACLVPFLPAHSAPATLVFLQLIKGLCTSGPWQMLCLLSASMHASNWTQFKYHFLKEASCDPLAPCQLSLVHLF